MKQSLATKLGEFTKKLKFKEEEYMKKYQEIIGDEVKYHSVDSEGQLEESSKQNSFLKMDGSNEVLAKRDKEITNLVESINELASVFKDLQILVFEQGTVLDRVDYNIETALQNTKSAHVELEKADKNMRSNCARNANMLLIFIVFVLSVLILFKIF